MSKTGYKIRVRCKGTYADHILTMAEEIIDLEEDLRKMRLFAIKLYGDEYAAGVESESLIEDFNHSFCYFCKELNEKEKPENKEGYTPVDNRKTLPKPPPGGTGEKERT